MRAGLITVTICLAIATSAILLQGQGTIDFRNDTSTPVFDVDGTTRLFSERVVANLYWATSTNGPWRVVNNATGIPADPVTFRNPTAPGIWDPLSGNNPDSSRVTGVAPSQRVFLVVVLWDGDGNGKQSPIWSQPQGGMGSPPSAPEPITGMGRFLGNFPLAPFTLNIVPEPRTIYLVALGGGAVLALCASKTVRMGHNRF